MHCNDVNYHLGRTDRRLLYFTSIPFSIGHIGNLDHYIFLSRTRTHGEAVLPPFLLPVQFLSFI